MGLLSEIYFYGHSTKWPGDYQATNQFNNGYGEEDKTMSLGEHRLHHLHLRISRPWSGAWHECSRSLIIA